MTNWESNILLATADVERGDLARVDVKRAVAQAQREHPDVARDALESALDVEVLQRGGRRLGGHWFLSAAEVAA